MKFIARSIILVVLCIFPSYRLFAQLDKFERPKSITDTHTVYQYQKSNWDGTHRSDIFLFVRDGQRLESFKWSDGDHVATLVVAWMDWNSFSINRFENWKVEQNKEPFMRAFLEQKVPGKMIFVAGNLKDTAVIESYPWHSYDFDFAGLGFAWRALKDKSEGFSFHINDIIMKDGKPVLVNKGTVQAKYDAVETVNDKKCLKYIIDGGGLENKGGKIWVDAETFMIQRYKILLSDEDGFVNGYLNLLKKEKMTPVQWEKFVRDKVR
jgi:hypothetical protein